MLSFLGSGSGCRLFFFFFLMIIFFGLVMNRSVLLRTIASYPAAVHTYKAYSVLQLLAQQLWKRSLEVKKTGDGSGIRKTRK